MTEPAGAGVDVFDPASGNLARVPAAEAAEPLRRGLVRPADGTIRIVRGNEVRETTADKLAEAESHGWALADDVGVRAARIRDEEDTVVGQAQGLGEQFASGLSFGLSDLALREMGADPERMAARAKATGRLGDAARLGGEVLPVLLTGGSSALGSTVRGVGALPRLVEGAGMLVESSMTRALGSGLIGRTSGALARGAVEGFASGVGEEVHESVLGDRELTAERMLTQGAMGALFGGGMSAAFPVTGSLLRRGSEVPAEAVKGVLGRATQGDPANMGAAAEWVETVASGRAFGPIKKQAELFRTKEGRQLAWDALHNADEVTARAAKVAKEETTSLAATVRDVVQRTEADRTANMGRLFSAADDEVVPDMVRRDLEAAYETLDAEGYSLVEKYGPHEISKRHLDTVRGELEKAWDDVVDGGLGAAESHRRLLGVKRRLQEVAKDAGRSDGKSKATSDLVRKMSRRVDDALGADAYGAAGVAYREMRDADRLALLASEKLFKTNRATGAREGKSLLGRILNGEATDSDILTFTKRTGNPRFADQADLADDYFERQIRAAEVRAKHSDDAGLRGEVEKLRKSQEKFRSTMRQQAKVADIIDANRASGRGGLTGALAAFGPSGAAVSGALLGGAPGMVVGAALNAAARPAQTIRTLAAVAHLADRAGVDVDSIVAKITRTGKSAGDAGGKVAKKAAPRRLADAGRRVGQRVRRGVAQSRGVASRGAAKVGVSRADEQRARQQRAEELSDPRALTQELSREMYALADAAPGIAGAATEKVGLAAAFLASKLPPPIHDPLSGTRQVIDLDTRDRFDRYTEAVVDPIATLRRLESGTMTVEHAEALREVWPALYGDVRDRTLSALQEAAHGGETLPLSRRIALGILFELPTDYTMTPEYQAAIAPQAAAEHAAEASETAAGRPARKVNYKSAARRMLPTERRERHEA